MNEAIELILKHRTTGALLDTNLLLVYAVGKFDRSLLPAFHHTKQYATDFALVERLVEYFPVIHTTPNVLTELSNLGGKLNSSQFFSVLRTLVNVLQEHYCVSTAAANNASFEKVGLTDAAIMTIASNDYLILTADWPLYNMLRSRNIDAVNVNHLRQLDWLGYFTLTT